MNTQVLSDRVLLNNYLSGDRGAISKLIDRHTNRVRDYIRMMVKDNDVADDILQRQVLVLDPPHRAQSGHRPFPRTQERQDRERVGRRIQHARYASFRRAHGGRPHDLGADRSRRSSARRPPPRRATRSGDDAILFGAELSGDSRPNRGEHQYGAGQNALRSDKPPKDD